MGVGGLVVVVVHHNGGGFGDVLGVCLMWVLGVWSLLSCTTTEEALEMCWAYIWHGCSQQTVSGGVDCRFRFHVS